MTTQQPANQRTIRDRSILFLIERPQSKKSKLGYVDLHGFVLAASDRLRYGDRIIQPLDHTRYYDETRGVLVNSLRNRLRAGNEERLICLRSALERLADKIELHEHLEVAVDTVEWDDDWDCSDDVPREYVSAEIDARN